MIADLLALGESRRQQLVQRPLLLASLVTAFFSGIVGIMNTLDDDAPVALLLTFLFLVALESILTTEWLARGEQRMTNAALYRLAELATLAVVARFVAWVGYGGWPDATLLRGLLLDPELIVDLPFAGIFIMAVVAWAQGASYADVFIQLRLRESELAFYELPLGRRDSALNDRPIDVDRSRYVARFLRGWVYGSVFLVLCAAISATNLPAIRAQPAFNRALFQNLGGLGLAPEVILGILVYFLLGFWLLSQARLAAMRSRWITDNIPASAGVTAQWRRYSLRTLLLAALVAAFIPIGSTLAIGRLLELAVLVAISIVNFVLLLFVLLLSLLLAPFGGRPLDDEAPPPQLQIPEQAPEMVPGAGMSETTATLLGALFWIAVVVAIGFAVYFFLRERGYRLQDVRLQRWWAAFLTWWRQIWRGVEDQLARAAESVRRRRPGSPATPDLPFRFLRINALSPREQVRYYYLSTVRRAGDRGAERRPGETPLEYVGVLREGWPDSEPDIAELTDAFLAARYSPADIPPDRLQRVKATWRRFRAALRRRRSARNGGAAQSED